VQAAGYGIILRDGNVSTTHMNLVNVSIVEDMRPESGVVYVDRVEKKAAELGLGEVVTVMGRYWAMDREENWDRVEKAYKALVGP
jgi:bisphosphoglycerate-independent phosphoglycerate mutase (AlkP superfamily)